MTRSLVLVGLTLRELVRSKLLYNLLLFAMLLIAGSFYVAQLTIGNWYRIILDQGLAAQELAGGMIAILIGINLVAGEIHRKTIYPTLARPISRESFFLSRYFGLLLLLAFNLGVTSLLLIAMLKVAQSPLPHGLLLAIVLLGVEQALLSAVALFFGSFTTPTLAASFSFVVFLVGHLSGGLAYSVAHTKGTAARELMSLALRGLPNLELLNLKSAVVNDHPFRAAEIGWPAAGYGLTYTAVVLLLAMGIFSRRDLK